MTEPSDIIRRNVTAIRERMATAAARSGRTAESVRLVAVTKYVNLRWTRAVVDAGCRDVGESRPQQLWDKASALDGVDIEWHLIGHLQRNKLRRTLPLVRWIHSGDSWRLLDALEHQTAESDMRVRVLLEVNLSGESAKHGLTFDELKTEGADRLAHYQALQICGLMGMTGWKVDADTARRQYASLRELRDRLQTQVGSTPQLSELSMGMSGDFEIAIEEGATCVRVGSSLFEGLPDSNLAD